VTGKSATNQGFDSEEERVSFLADLRAVSANWRGAKVVVFNAANGWAEERMADHQLAAALSRHIPVVYVDPCTSIATRVRSGGSWRPAPGERIQEVLDKLLRVRPEGLPGISRRNVVAINKHLMVWQLRRLVARLHLDVVSIIEANLLTPVLGRLDAQRAVYWAQDDFVGMAPLVKVDPGIIEYAEARLLAAADEVIAANPLVAEHCRRAHGSVSLIPFGCDYELFATTKSVGPAVVSGLDKPVVILMGTINDRLDLGILAAIAARDVSLLMLGPKARGWESEAFDRLVGKANVTWLGPVSFRDLPAYLALASVGIVPYTGSRFNLGSFPLKTYEYLAAGLPVVATDLPAIRSIGSEHITVRSDPDDFANAVLAAANGSRDPSLVVERQNLARAGSWLNRAEEFYRVAVPRPVNLTSAAQRI
jgi:teichuronic acid biosynthesis glycosyltransferase TuaH